MGSCLTKMCMINLVITFHIPGQWQTQSPSVEVMPDNNVSFSANILYHTMDRPLHWRRVNTYCRVMCAYCACVTIRRTSWYVRWYVLWIPPFVNKVSVQYFSAENKQDAAAFYSQNLPVNFLTSYERSNQVWADDTLLHVWNDYKRLPKVLND